LGLFSDHSVKPAGEAFRSPVRWGCSRLQQQLEGKAGENSEPVAVLARL